MKNPSPPWRETGVMGKVIQYRYGEGWTGTPDEIDLQHINTQVTQGYVEGELCTANPEDPDGSNILRGWWRIKPEEETHASPAKSPSEDPCRTLIEQHVLANVTQLLLMLPDRPEFLTDEVLECWAVSEWLHYRLNQEGQAVGQIGGLYLWGRRTSGQAIRLDDVIIGIASSEGQPSTSSLYLDLRDACDALDGLDRRTSVKARRKCQLDALERIVKAVEGLDARQVALAEIKREVSEAEDLYNNHCEKLGDEHDRGRLTPDQADRYMKLPCWFEDIVFSSGGRD